MESGRVARQNHTALTTSVVKDELDTILDTDLPQPTPFHDEGSIEILAARPDSPCSSDPSLPAAQLAAEMQASFAEQTQQSDISEDNALANANPAEASDLESSSISAAEIAIYNDAPPKASSLALAKSIQPVISSTERSPKASKMGSGESIISPSAVSRSTSGPVSLHATQRFGIPRTHHSNRLIACISSVNTQPETEKSQEPEQSFSSPSLSNQSNSAMGKRSRKSPVLAAPPFKRTKTTEWFPRPPLLAAEQSNFMESGCINVLSTEERKRSLKTTRIAPVIKTSPVLNGLLSPSTEYSQARPSSRHRSSHPLSSPKDMPLPKASRGTPIADNHLMPAPIVTSQHSQSRRSNRLSESQAEYSTEDLQPRRRRKRQSVQPGDGPQAAVEAVSSKKRKGKDGKALVSDDKSNQPNVAVVIPLQTFESPVQQDKPESPLAIRKILSPKSIMAKLRALIVEAGEVVFGKEEQVEFTDAAFELVAAARGYTMG
jgi:hypothetical protein